VWAWHASTCYANPLLSACVADPIPRAQEVLHGPIHYETVRHREIRTMGTGYYRFSTDEAERGEQMAALGSLREQVSAAHRPSRPALNSTRHRLM